jgi:hypothetical protein
MRRFLSVAGLVLWAAGASAMVVPVALPELIAQSDVIVRGQITGLESSWTSDRSTIQTDVTLQVVELVVTRVGLVEQNEITFRVEGGKIGEQEVRTSIDPIFEEGDEGIFFLNFGTDGERLTLVGRSQGYLRIENGQVSVEGETKTVEKLISEIQEY